MTFTEAFHPPDNDDKGSACGVGLEGWLSERGGKHAVATVPLQLILILRYLCQRVLKRFCKQLVNFLFYVLSVHWMERYKTTTTSKSRHN